MIGISVGVCAYNEERNIHRLLESVQGQLANGYELLETIVVSSGSTDRTDMFVRERMAADVRIHLISQPMREGKNSAINEFMKAAKGEILVLANADNVLDPDSLSKLIAPFQDPTIGMVGGRPVPSNSKESIPGFASYMLWDMHHRLSLISPKIGELVAFRNQHIVLPNDMQSDEDIIRMELEKRGMHVAYAPDAIVHNRGPETIRDFLKQRTRVNIGEKYMKRAYEYEIPTWNPRYLFAAYLGFMKDNARHPIRMAAAVALEALARACASVHVALDRGDKAVWSQVTSTKDVGDGDQRD